MRTIILLGFLGFFLLMTSCNGSDHQDQDSNQNNEADLQAALQGTWQIYQINVAVNSVDGLDSFHVVNLNEGVWENNFGVKPPVYYFQADQKYRLLRMDLTGTAIAETKGKWSTVGDTLILDTENKNEKYLVKHGNGKAGFRTFLDWDGDGELDDEYQSILRQISIGTE